MAAIWKPQPISVYKDWAEAIIDEASDKLNSWETTFVNSIYERLQSGNNLSEAQANKLEHIYAEKTK